MNKEEYDAERFMAGFMDGINIGIKNIADQFKELKEKCERLNKENDKLREFAKNIYQYERKGCFECPYSDGCESGTLYDDDCQMQQKVERDGKELGIGINKPEKGPLNESDH